MRVFIVSVMLVLFQFTSAFAQVKPVNKTDINPAASNNNWAIGMFYSDNGFGLSGTFSSRLARTTDLNFKLSISGVTDNSEVEYYDYYGNSIIRGKENRVFMSTLSIGLKHNIFFDDIEGNFKPLIKGGIAPTLIFFSPYSKTFFDSFKYAQTSYGLGVYGGVGIEYYESKSIGLGITFEYYYIPVLGPDVYSLKDKKITNVGGVQIGFTFMFL
ncbi:MAG: hypothetical protein WC139_01320 [Candidatus Kapaibacterium sp.]